MNVLTLSSAMGVQTEPQVKPTMVRHTREAFSFGAVQNRWQPIDGLRLVIYEK